MWILLYNGNFWYIIGGIYVLQNIHKLSRMSIDWFVVITTLRLLGKQDL